MFFHLLQTTLYGTPHSTFIYALGLGNLAIALAEDNTGIHSAALDLRQGVESVPESAELIHAFQQLLRGRLVQTGRVFDPIIAIEGILRFVADDPPLVGSLVQLVRPQFGGHFIGNFDIFIVGVLRVKLFQIDDSHYIFLRSDSWVDGVLNGEGAGIDSRGCQLWDNLSQGKNI